jgi:hypothetical protein
VGQWFSGYHARASSPLRVKPVEGTCPELDEGSFAAAWFESLNH